METIEQIQQMCNGPVNNWFLNHNFPKIALHDLKREDDVDYENLRNFEISEKVDIQPSGCMMGGIYRDDTRGYVKSKWILPDKINGEIPGFILIKCFGDQFEQDGISHEIYFAFVRKKYRKKGILKSMISKIPKEWNIWLEASSTEISHVENIWEKCGFSFYKNMNGRYLYKRKNY